MRKVCHILDSLKVGGIEKNVIEIAAGLESFEHHVWFLQDKGPLADELERKGIAIREFGFRGAMRPGALITLVQAMRKERFDIVNGHGLYPSMWSSAAGFMAGVPVRIVHAQSTYGALSWRDTMKLRLLMPVTSKIVAVSEAVRESLVVNVGLPEEKIEIIYNSASDMRIAAGLSRCATRESLGIGDSFAVGCVGRLVDFKGQEYLIEAIKNVRRRGVNATCIIVGDGPERERLEAIASAAELSDAVHFLGTRYDIATVLSAMDSLIQPSIVREGLPLSLAEGASMGLPLIATEIGGNDEIVSDGENGFIVPPRDAEALTEKIIYLAKNPAEVQRMGERSRKIWEERFTAAEMVGRLGALYKKCLGERS